MVCVYYCFSVAVHICEVNCVAISVTVFLIVIMAFKQDIRNLANSELFFANVIFISASNQRREHFDHC